MIDHETIEEKVGGWLHLGAWVAATIGLAYGTVAGNVPCAVLATFFLVDLSFELLFLQGGDLP